MRVSATVFVLMKISTCTSAPPVSEVQMFDVQRDCEAVASALNEVNDNDWLGRKGLDQYVCVERQRP